MSRPKTPPPRHRSPAAKTPGPGSVSSANHAAAQTLFEQGRQAQTERRWADAAQLYENALQRNPALWPARFEWGVACYGQGLLNEAVGHIRKALTLEPRFARAHSALGTFLGLLGQPAQAVVHLQRAAELEPGSAETHYNLGRAWQAQNAFSQAEDAYRVATKLDPHHALAQLNLGKVISELGRTREGLAQYQLAHHQLAHIQTTQPSLTEPSVMSSLPMMMNFADNVSDQHVFDAHRDYNQRLVAPLLAQASACSNPKDPHKRLRLGYLSRDLRQHSVRYFLLPIWAHHQHAQFEVTAYCDNVVSDATTELFRTHADRWLDCQGLSDQALAQRIRADGIDILVDLAGHTADHRLLALARRAAPVQITYLGYPATTGIDGIDHRVSDRHIDPLPPQAGVASSEAPLRLGHGYFCYEPMADSPTVGDAPFQRNGFITFGCLNQSSKLTPTLLDAWAQILQQRPTARLCLQNGAMREARGRAHMTEEMARRGVQAQRLIFKPFAPAPQYLQAYRDIDIALDSFPYNGGTTTCEALWMGVPVVSWCGTRHVGRLGLSVLNAVGLGDLVAHSQADYVARALELAADPERLLALRSGMRQRMVASPLMDHAGFTQALEAAYRQAWQDWCSQG